MIKAIKKTLWLTIFYIMCNKLFSAELESNSTAIFNIINEKKLT